MSAQQHGLLKQPASFTLMQNDQFVFLQVNLDVKEFNQAQAEPEVDVVGDTHVITGEEVIQEVAGEESQNENNALEKDSARRLDFYAAPFMLKLRFN